MIEESEYFSKVIKTKFSKPLVLKFLEKFLIFKKAYEESEAKVKYHDPITGKYRGSAQILVVFHNFQNYDSHLSS